MTEGKVGRPQLDEETREKNRANYTSRYKAKVKELNEQRKGENEKLVERLRKILPEVEITHSSQSIKIYVSGKKCEEFVSKMENLVK